MNDFEIIRKEVVVAYLQVLSCHLTGWIKQKLNKIVIATS
jgi:hypothetical protein